MDKSLYGELKMFLYSKFTFFPRNLDKNAFIDYYYTRMKNKFKLISYLFGFNVLAVLFTLCWMVVMLPFYMLKACGNSIKEIYAFISSQNRTIYKYLSSAESTGQIKPKINPEKIPDWFQ